MCVEVQSCLCESACFYVHMYSRVCNLSKIHLSFSSSKCELVRKEGHGDHLIHVNNSTIV